MYKYKEKSFQKIEELIKLFSANEFSSPYRSTIPLIYLALNHTELIDSFSEKKLAIFEHETRPKKGRGYPSCTDLLLLDEDECIAIEAKRTEPPYKTVSAWNSGSENKRLVLEGWLEYIAEYTNQGISISEIGDLPYQLVHRVASACAMKKTNTTVSYFVFDPDRVKDEYYLEILRGIKNLTNTSIKYKYVAFKIDKSERQIQLEEEWDLGNREMKTSIIAELEKGSLMQIKKIRAVEI